MAARRIIAEEETVARCLQWGKTRLCKSASDGIGSGCTRWLQVAGGAVVARLGHGRLRTIVVVVI
ncbi:NADPH2:quinone reductase [Sesbania bispinosa]|nr:NADPH2:quinone reductase [Sesbania bispinosa]